MTAGRRPRDSFFAERAGSGSVPAGGANGGSDAASEKFRDSEQSNAARRWAPTITTTLRRCCAPRTESAYVPRARARRPILPLNRTWFTPARPRTLNRPTTAHDGAGPRTTNTTRVGTLSRNVIRVPRVRAPVLTRRGEARSPLTRACLRELEPAGWRGFTEEAEYS